MFPERHTRLHAYGKLYWTLSWDVRDAGTFLKRRRVREQVMRTPCSPVKERGVQTIVSGSGQDLRAVELDEMIDLVMERKVKAMLRNDSSH